VTGWSNRYRQARTDNVPSYGAVMAWLAARTPPDVRRCVIHNDFRFDNIVFDVGGPGGAGPGHAGGPQVAGVLDWEMATLGDPLMDLGGALAYWVQADDDEAFRLTRRQPTHTPGMPSRAEVVDHYCARTGLTVRNWSFYEVFGLFRLAVIVQQIYFRYHHGQTTNPAFKDFRFVVDYLDRRCTRIIQTGKA
jgi:aminoglycoside phosphotransferase (APT) family kinase protein